MKGIYGLIVHAQGEVAVGRCGQLVVDGFCVYVGSAQGPGGLSRRAARHRAVLSGATPTRHWHIDYLLGISARVDAIGAATSDPEAECALARELAQHHPLGLDGFGASDCRCPSHLFRLSSGDPEPLARALQALGWEPVPLLDHR